MLVREDGALLEWAGTGPGSSAQAVGGVPVFGGWGRSQPVVEEAIRQAIGDHLPDELHICVVGRFLEGFCAQDRVKNVQIHVIDEPTGAFTLAGVREGVCVLSGTGSFVHGRSRDGRERHLDGLGPLLGDRGSGYDIGLRTLQAAARSGWHPRHRTSLAGVVRNVCGGRADDSEGLSLIAYMAAPRDRSEIARLSRLALRAAADGDRVAVQVLHDAAAALAETIYDMVDQLGMTKEDYLLIGTGGVIAHSDIYWEHLCALAKVFAPRLRPQRAELPPVVGVALTALERLPGVEVQAARERLFAGCRAKLRTEEAFGS
jgi:N-acetylglucosamine kinase-like BadF-type ATPase